MSTPQPTLETIVALAKRRGFVYPTSEIYGGLANAYDLGPLGVELMRRLKDAWWNFFITRRPDMVGLDTQIIQHPQTWVASGHVGGFSDPLVEDTVTHKRYRADHLVEDWIERQQKKGKTEFDQLVVETLDLEALGAFIADNKVLSPDGNPVSAPKSFNLLFESQIGAVSGDKSKVYLRGETAQGIFTNFKQVLDSTRVQLPFGIGNIGRSFRNEITTGQFIFRTLEFEQAEIEYFFDPEKENWQQLLTDWKDAMWEFVTKDLGIDPDHLRWRRHTDEERSFYSTDTYDLDYKFPFGFKELWGIAYRTDYDLKQHMEHSGKSLEYRDPHTQKVFIPHVIEPALGINRLLMMTLCDFYWEDTDNNRIVLNLPAKLAPYTAAVFPLVKNKPELVAKANEVFTQLLDAGLAVTWDERGNIGKRYLYQDEIGTPACITVDYETMETGEVTVRDRQSTEQTRVAIDQLETYLQKMVH